MEVVCGGGGELGHSVIRITLYGGLVGPSHPSGGALAYAVV